MRRSRRQNDEEAAIDLTPMLDVVFILLIFFIVTASFTQDTGVEINAPAASTASAQENSAIRVAIDTHGQVWINRQPVDVRSVRAHLARRRAESPKAALVIEADRDSKNGVLVEVMNAARRAGLSQIAVSATPETE